MAWISLLQMVHSINVVRCERSLFIYALVHCPNIPMPNTLKMYINQTRNVLQKSLYDRHKQSLSLYMRSSQFSCLGCVTRRNLKYDNTIWDILLLFSYFMQNIMVERVRQPFTLNTYYFMVRQSVIFSVYDSSYSPWVSMVCKYIFLD